MEAYREATPNASPPNNPRPTPNRRQPSDAPLTPMPPPTNRPRKVLAALELMYA